MRQFAIPAVALIGLGLPTLDVRAQDIRAPDLKRATKSGQEVGVGRAIRWTRDCRSLRPRLILDIPPAHGSVCSRPLTFAPKRNVVNDDQACVGKSMLGLQIFYFPQPGYVGPDTVDYVIEFPKKRFKNHVDIDVGSEPGAPAPKVDDKPLDSGKSGDIIAACAPLMS